MTGKRRAQFNHSLELMGLPRGFKGLKQAIKLEFKLGQYDKVRSIWSLSSHEAHFARL